MARASYSSPDYDAVALTRFLALCGDPDPTDDVACWIWTGGETGKGYGCFGYRGRNVLAHRWSYSHYRGPIPAGLTLDHIVCDTPACVNPWHTEPRTRGENVLRSQTNPVAINARKAHCKHGHRFTKKNTYVTPDGRRQCRVCLQEANLRNIAKRTEKRRLAREARGWKPWPVN